MSRKTKEGSLILPKAVCLAHEYAKDVGGLYQEELRGYLMPIIIRIIKETRSRLRGRK